MSQPSTAPSRPALSIGQAVATWLLGWLLGSLLSVVLVGAAGYSKNPDEAPVWVYGLAALGAWIPMLVIVWLAVRRLGSGDVIAETRTRFRPIDLIGLPIGALSQLVLVRLIYWPLGEWWPDTFSQEQVRKNAESLWDRAHGGWLVVLVILVAVCAPLIEEFVYRGLLQGAAERRLQAAAAVLAVAALFALIHFRPVEYPGLFAFGLVLGVCAWRTQRIGMAVFAHVAFNAVGLAMVAAR